MNWLDVALILVVGVSAYMGLKFGLIRAGFTAIGVFFGSVLCGRQCDDIVVFFVGSERDF